LILATTLSETDLITVKNQQDIINLHGSFCKVGPLHPSCQIVTKPEFSQ